MFSDKDVAAEEEARLLRSMQKKKTPRGTGKTWSERRKEMEERKKQQQKQMPKNKGPSPSAKRNQMMRSGLSPGGLRPNSVSQGKTTMRMKNSSKKTEIREHKAFVGWANWVLKNEGVVIENLTTDLQSGTKLCKLAQVLTGKKFKFMEKPKMSFHKYENVNLAVTTLKKQQKNLLLSDVKVFEKEKLPPILGFFYQLINEYTANWGRAENENKNEKGEKKKSSKLVAYEWAEKTTKGYESCKGKKPTEAGARDFSDGALIKALVHKSLIGTEGEFKLEDLDKLDERTALTFVLDSAEDHLNVPAFITAEDVLDEFVPPERQLIPWLLALKAQVYQSKQNPSQRSTMTPQLPSQSSSIELTLPSITVEQIEEPKKNVQKNLQKNNMGVSGRGSRTRDPMELSPGKKNRNQFSTMGRNFAKKVATEKESHKLCTKCKNPLGSGTIVVVDDQLYHDDCFVCTTCQANFTKFYWSWEGNPYCFTHYQDAAGLFCAKCDGRINDKTVVLAMDKKWHEDCFACQTCKKKLDDKYYLYEGHIYCDEHYFKTAGEICSLCEEPIKGQTIIEALGKKWHPVCFCCADCHLPLLPEGSKPLPFFNNGGKPYCTKCDNKLHGLSEENICAKCNKIISGHITEAMGKVWHEDCFICTGCSKQFESSYVNISGKPYCKACTR